MTRSGNGSKLDGRIGVAGRKLDGRIGVAGRIGVIIMMMMMMIMMQVIQNQHLSQRKKHWTKSGLIFLVPFSLHDSSAFLLWGKKTKVARFSWGNH